MRRRQELENVYQQMLAEGLTFEGSVQEVCANMGIAPTMAPFVGRLMVDTLKSDLATYSMGPSHLVSGNVDPRYTYDVRAVRKAMEQSEVGRELLCRCGMLDKADVVPLPAVLESDSEGFFMNPRYRLPAENPELDHEIAELRKEVMKYATKFWMDINR